MFIGELEKEKRKVVGGLGKKFSGDTYKIKKPRERKSSTVKLNID